MEQVGCEAGSSAEVILKEVSRRPVSRLVANHICSQSLGRSQDACRQRTLTWAVTYTTSLTSNLAGGCLFRARARSKAETIIKKGRVFPALYVNVPTIVVFGHS